MLVESFLANLALFVAGQAAAWYYLRTGRLWWGGLSMAVLWVAADWAVVARYVFGDTGAHYRTALLVLQLTAIATVVALGVALWRRRWSATARQRGELFAEGTRHYLASRHEAARAMFVRLVRADPWDAAAWLALGNAQRRLGQTAASRRSYRRCRRVDLAGEYAELAAALAAPPARPAATPAAAEPVTSPAPRRSSPPAHPARS